jgi:MFS family permease
MQGVGENYLSAFALLLHAAPVQIGLLSALPQLVGTWSQLASVKALNRLQQRKGLIVGGASLQAALWLPLVALPLLFPEHGPWLLILCAVAYFASGHFAVPAWNSLIADLVHPERRGAYFARRSTIMAVSNFLALCAAGVVLHWAESKGGLWAGFLAVFLTAGAARAFSSYCLARIDETAVPPTREADLRFIPFLLQDRQRNFRRFLLFSGLMHVCVLISGPYFVVYMLRDLHFTYLEYTFWLAAGVLGQFLSLRPWGHFGDRFGNKRVLLVTGLLVPFLPMAYLLSTALAAVVTINFFGGVVWAGFGLALQNYVLDTVRPEDRAKGVAVWNTVNAAGWFGGAMFGGWLAVVLPSDLAWAGLSFPLASNLQLVFCISGLLRLAVSVSLLGTFAETRKLEPASRREMVAHLPLVKPLVDVLGGRDSWQ